ncbi:DUF2163 domain-containing protein [bacterium]|nr:DUF2163 domain-containing protein [bacterium]
MRRLSDLLATRLQAEVATLCACWRFERRDGAVFGATDHDRPIDFDGVRFEPANGIAGARFEHGATLAPGRAAGEGALDLAFLDEADLAAGVWDGARVDVWRVDWSAPEHRVRIWSGRLSEVERRGRSFAAELVSLKADLETMIGRIYQRTCDAEVGDERCGVDLGAAAFRGTGVVSEVLAPERFRVSGLDGFAGGWFTLGRLAWMSGENSGAVHRITRHDAVDGEAVIELGDAPRHPVRAGDTFAVTAGCDRRFETCGGKFANRVNFRGFPHLIGNDAVVRGPSPHEPKDGGRR